jgi:hypothetical protein
MGYCSKEILKHDFVLPEDIVLENLLTEELVGLYLSGMISEGKFIEVTGISYEDFLKMRKNLSKAIGEFAERDKQIEIEMW